MADDLALAASLVRDAGRLAADMRRAGLQTHRKTSASDVVSAADHAAEELIVSRLREARPDDGVIGEEGTSIAGTSPGTASGTASAAGGRTWFVDPVDGTYNFLAGLPFWCSALALVDADGPLLGAVYHATSDELWLGGRDTPTTCNGVPVRVPEGQPLAEASLASYLHPPMLPRDEVRLPWLRVVGAAATVRILGSGSIELASVAAGRLGGWMQRDCLDWDWYPGAALVHAAGGTTRVVDVGQYRWHVAGSHRIVDEITELLERR